MRNSDREAYDPESYDSEAMAADIVDAIDSTIYAEVGETFHRAAEPGLGSHAFNIVTPRGRKFLVTVTQVENESP